MLPLGSFFADRYRIDAEIGRGAFGVVYRAYDVRDERAVAVKVLLPEAAADETLRHRLRREAKLTAEMTSPHCVRIFDVAETTAGQVYITMELLDGCELHELLGREKKLPPARAAEIARQVLEAVGEAHELGVVHRDIKPHNIFVCRTDSGADFVKVLDFGIAKVAGRTDGGGLSETARLTTQGTVIGTPVYMSPEQCRGDMPSPASDIYATGVVLYEMLCGRPPFDDENPVRILMKHNSEAPPPLPADVALSPAGKAAMRALEKHTLKRFTDAREFAAALGLAKTSVIAESEPEQPEKPATVTMRLSQVMKLNAAGNVSDEKPERASRPPVVAKKQVWLTVLAVAVATLIGLTVWLAVRNGS